MGEVHDKIDGILSLEILRFRLVLQTERSAVLEDKKSRQVTENFSSGSSEFYKGNKLTTKCNRMSSL